MERKSEWCQIPVVSYLLTLRYSTKLAIWEVALTFDNKALMICTCCALPPKCIYFRRYRQKKPSSQEWVRQRYLSFARQLQ